MIVFHQHGANTRAAALRVADEVYELQAVARSLGVDPAGLESADSLLADWDRHGDMVAQICAEFAGDRQDGPRPVARVGELSLKPPTSFGGAVYAVGANYHDHVSEMAIAIGTPAPSDPRPPGAMPWFFQMPARNCLVGHRSKVARPRGCRQLDWEAELAVVVGKGGRNIPAEVALEHIAGYTVANDLSARDLFVRQNLPPASPFRYDWLAHKSFPGSCPLGPGLVPARGIDPQRLRVRLWVNDELLQDSHTGQMIFSVAEQIASLSAQVSLYPGDVILTGTPAGVGMARGRFLGEGDHARVTIEGIGTIENEIVAE
jgi:2-keto-4-pentenoate hydratase/2-oxohepta-3-ene-1,7-dioic acid hydratase in catechol pathway